MNLSGMNKHLIILTTIAMLLLLWGVQTKAAMPNIPPSLIAQFNQMSPAEQRALAAQYGVNVADLLSKNSGAEPATKQTLAAPAAPIKPIKDTPAAAPTNAPAAREAPKAVAAAELEVKAVQPALSRFGSQIFDAKVSTFAPVDNIPVPPGYLLGVGDSISIMLYGKQALQTELVVDREGAINFPQLGPIPLAGLPWSEARTVIQTRVKQQLIGTQVVASLGRLRSINIFMAGEVAVPGNYSVSALTTITQAVYTAGGISSFGSYRDIQVKRNGETVASFDLYDLLLKGSLEKDVRLQTGDVLFVPPTAATISIQGQVLRPAKFEVKADETLGDVLTMAGGLLFSSYASQAVMQRYDPNQELPILMNIDLTNVQALSQSLVDGDVLTVAKKTTRVENPIRLKGAVERPGVYAWQPGIRISDFLKDGDGFLKESVDLDIAVLVRRKNNRMDIEVLTFNLGEAIANPGSTNDLELAAHDEILVFSLTELGGLRSALINPVIARLKRQADEQEWPKIVSLAGAVDKDGEFPLVEGQRLSDLLELAGGENYLSIKIDRKIALLVRRQSNLIDITVQTIDLGTALLNPGGPEDPLLAPLDEIILFNREGTRLGLVGPTVDSLRRQATRDEWPHVVQVMGSLEGAGAYPLTENQRVSSLLTLVGGSNYLNIDVDPRVALIVRKAESLVDIKVIPFNLGAALENPQSESDPLLEPLDQLMIFDLVTGDGSNRSELLASIIKRLRNEATADREAQVVTIQGKVRLPGDYPILASGDLHYLIDLAGGFDAGAYVDEAEVSRKFIGPDKDERTELLTVDLADATSMQSFELRPRDVLRVNTIPGWRASQNVTLRGEVVFPGTYTLEAGETLFSVLSRAGGLTERAYPKGAVYTNQVAKAQQMRRAEQILNNVEKEAASRSTVQVDNLSPTSITNQQATLLNYIDGRVVINLSQIIKGDKKANFEMQDGDTLEVPAENKTVAVVGEVQNPGTFFIDEGRSRSDFISLAGQETRYADINRTYVIKADGSVRHRGGAIWSSAFSRGRNIEAGDTIVVPTNPDYEPPIERVSAVTSVVFQSMASLAAFFSISNNTD